MVKPKVIEVGEYRGALPNLKKQLKDSFLRVLSTNFKTRQI